MAINNKKMQYTVNSVLGVGNGKSEIKVAAGDESYALRLINHELDSEMYKTMKDQVEYLGVTDNFKEVIDYFRVPDGETPAGFRVEYVLESDGVCRADLVRDISYDKNEIIRPTKYLFSADTANPYEVAHIKDMIANLTCNPAIIYNYFINNPQANVGGKFKTRDEVMMEISKILGPGVDISVELNDPFGSSEAQILEEAAYFKEILSKHRVVIKVPHTASINKDNVKELLTGDQKFYRAWNQGTTEDRLRGHNLAIMLKEHGYRVNFTLMFDPFQTALALQARPYFINSFVSARMLQSKHMLGLLNAYNTTSDKSFMDMLKQFMLDNDYIGANQADMDLLEIKSVAEAVLKYRNYTDASTDGLDGLRHNLRQLSRINNSETRLIICNYQGCDIYQYVDKVLMEDEFKDVLDKVVITASPEIISQHATSPLVVQYQRKFMNAAAGQK